MNDLEKMIQLYDELKIPFSIDRREDHKSDEDYYGDIDFYGGEKYPEHNETLTIASWRFETIFHFKGGKYLSYYTTE